METEIEEPRSRKIARWILIGIAVVVLVAAIFTLMDRNADIRTRVDSLGYIFSFLLFAGMWRLFKRRGCLLLVVAFSAGRILASILFFS